MLAKVATFSAALVGSVVEFGCFIMDFFVNVLFAHFGRFCETESFARIDYAAAIP